MFERAAMPWGKYHGQLLARIPLSYLAWLWEPPDFRSGDEWLHAAALEHLQRRLLACYPSVGAHSGDAVRIVQTCYRELALRHHPDRSGATEVMQAINDFYEQLQQRLRTH